MEIKKRAWKAISRFPAMADLWIALSVLRTDLPVALNTPAVRRTSRAAFGWSTSSPTRQWEYPWVLRQVSDFQSQSHTMRAADFGAGKSPVPILLSRMGYHTSVVDPGTLGTAYSNEWDFVRYDDWGIPTHKGGMEDRVFDEASLGIAASVSVIEHISAEARRKSFNELARALEPNGLLVLTIDLLHGVERYLWNRIVDEIEPVSVHGRVDDLLGEAAASGFQLRSMVPCPVTRGESDVLGLTFRRLP